MSQYKDLLKQREELEAKIAEALNAEVASAIAQVRQLVLDYSLTERDVFGGVRTSSAKGSTVAPKYKDRQGGYTRIIKTGVRQGDAAPMVIIELV